MKIWMVKVTVTQSECLQIQKVDLLLDLQNNISPVITSALQKNLYF